MSETAPYGSWTSPIVPALLTGAVPGYAWPRVDRGNLYWLESRPWENGRSVIVQKDPKGNVRDVLKAPSAPAAGYTQIRWRSLPGS